LTGRFGIALVVLLNVVSCNGPLPFLSAGELAGDLQPTPAKWAFDDDFGVIQLETRPAEPYSVNLAYTLVDGSLYIHAGDTRTEWVRHIETDPRVRFRLNESIYELAATRVTDPAEISAFAKAWVSHSAFHRDPESLDEIWLYRLAAR